MLLIENDVPIIMAWGKEKWLEDLAGYGFRSLPSDPYILVWQPSKSFFVTDNY